MKINEILTKYLVYAIYTILLLLLMNTCSTCSRNTENTKMRKHVLELKSKIDSIAKISYSAEELNLLLELQGLENSKRTLYDWNSIVRTVVRPDDRMNSYDKQIYIINKKLLELNKNKVK